MVGDGGFPVVQRGVSGRGGEINEVFTAVMSIFINFKGRVGVSTLSVLRELVLVEVRALSIAGFGRYVVLRAPVAERRVYALVK